VRPFDYLVVGAGLFGATFARAACDIGKKCLVRERSWGSGIEPAYPIEDERNRKLYSRYRKRAETDGYIVGGRLAEYRYYDMHQVIASALKTATKEVGLSEARFSDRVTKISR
jgi:UDP-galactopyranose mutase